VLARHGLDAAARNPWVFPDADTYAGLLRAVGFGIDALSLFPRPTPLPGSITGWLAAFGGQFLQGCSVGQRATIVAQVSTASSNESFNSPTNRRKGVGCWV
jgi:hypothetical protein